jgi:hypothetical protein
VSAAQGQGERRAALSISLIALGAAMGSGQERWENAALPHVRFWHKADVAMVGDVRFRR